MTWPIRAAALLLLSCGPAAAAVLHADDEILTIVAADRAEAMAFKAEIEPRLHPLAPGPIVNEAGNYSIAVASRQNWSEPEVRAYLETFLARRRAGERYLPVTVVFEQIDPRPTDELKVSIRRLAVELKMLVLFIVYETPAS